MTTINQLSRLDTITAGDLLAVWATNKGDDRAAAMSVLLEYIQNNIQFPRDGATQYLVPSADNFEVQVLDGTTWILITPEADRANGTILLPPSPKDNDSLIISTTRNLTNLTVRSTVVNVPFGASTLTENTALIVKYNTQLSNWFVAG